LSQGNMLKPVAPTLESGSITPVSGVYRCEHSGCCEKAVWIRQGEVLPPCPRCGENAQFTLEEQVQHISEDPDFTMV